MTVGDDDPDAVKQAVRIAVDEIFGVPEP